MFTINRTYIHRRFGTVGSVTFKAPAGDYTLDGVALPAESVEHLLNFALQTLQDAYAGAENADEAGANFGKKLDRLKTGGIGTRGGGEGRPDWWGEAVSLLRPTLKGADAARYKNADEPGRRAWAAEVFDAMSDAKKSTIRAAAEKRLAAKRAEAAEAAALAAALGDIEI